MSSQNHFTFQIKNPASTKNKTNNNMIAMKRIQNYSYALSDEIGLGFTSHVYRGKCQLTNKKVAVKVIQLKNNQDQLHSNFLKEQVAVLETIKNANSKNLLKLEKVIKSKNNLYIITEFCQGNDVAKILRKKRMFPQAEAQSIMKQALNGYKQLYKLKIVHRDLKLANLFIKKGQVKIADFGFAIGQQQCKIKMDYNVGSPYYMPPQSLKQNQYSFISDVWSFGIIAYQLVYGRVPWKDKDDEVLYQMIMNCPIQKLFDSDKQVSDHYKKFIKACLTIDRRYRTTPEFIINYQWPWATQYVQGLQDPNQFRYSVGGKNFPRLSVQKADFKKFASQNIKIQQIRKRTPSVDNIINFKVQEKGPSLVQPSPRNQTIVTRSFIHHQKNFNEPSRQKLSTFNNSQTKNSTIMENETQKLIVGQINYCRFILQLYKILRRNFSRNQTVVKVESQLISTLAQKIKKLVKMAQSQQNILKSQYFTSYIRSNRWQSIRQVIYKYDMKFREQVNLSQAGARNYDNSSLIQVIRDIKNVLPQHTKILEFLTYYYQLKQQQSKSPIQNLQEAMKLSYLVDECKLYSAGTKQFEINQIQQASNRERLLRKLAIMGL